MKSSKSLALMLEIKKIASNVCIEADTDEEFIEKFSNKVNWFCISKYQKLSENFIQKFSDKVNWDYISQYQKLSDNFIQKFSDKVNWDYISKYQKLSENFIQNEHLKQKFEKKE